MRKILAATIFLSMAACGPSVFVMRYGPEKWPATRQVEVLHDVPARPFIQLAALSVEVTESAVLQLRAEAAKLGANAIVVGQPEQRLEEPSAVAVGLAGAGQNMNQGYYVPPRPHVVTVISAVAVRWKEAP